MKTITICLFATLVAKTVSFGTNFLFTSPILTLNKTVVALTPDKAAYVEGVDTVLGVTGVGILDAGYKTVEALASLDAGPGLVAGAGGIVGADDNNNIIAAGAAGAEAAGAEAAGSQAAGIAGGALGPDGYLAGGAGGVQILDLANGGVAVLADNAGESVVAVGNAADTIAGEIAAKNDF